MAGPWEAYAQQSDGPWARYAAPAAQPNAEPWSPMDLLKPITDIPGEIASAATSAASSIADSLNPFSETRTKALEERAKGNSFLADVGAQIKGLGGTGRGLAAIPELAASPVTGAARSLIGHPYAALTGMPYDEAKGAVDTAMLALAPRSTSPAGARTAPAKIPTAQELKDAAKIAYQSPEVKGLRIDPYASDLLGAKIEADLTGQGFRPMPANAQGAFSAVGELRRKPGAAPVSVDDLDSVRKALGMTAKQRDAIGQPTPDAAAAKAAIRQIDDYLANVPAVDVIRGNAPAAQAKLTEARGNYSAGKRASEIDYRLDKAERQAARSGSGMNIENARRQKVDQVSDYGLTPQEIALRNKIVLGTPARNALRTVGKLGVDGGLSLLLNTSMGLASGGATLPITFGGTAARLLGQTLTKQQIKQLNEMIRSRAPLSQAQMPAPMPVPNGLLGAMYPNLLPPGIAGALSVSQSVKERR